VFPTTGKGQKILIPAAFDCLVRVFDTFMRLFIALMPVFDAVKIAWAQIPCSEF
jgi:hypothetical protein